jgi:uncharacterized protein YbjT (DUF2867 family)
MSIGSTIVLFGGTGFIGRHLVQHLLGSGTAVRVVSRRADMRGMANGSGRSLRIVRADVLDEAAVLDAVWGADAVVNLVGVLTEGRKQTYRNLHVVGARHVARNAERQGVKRLVHISALGVSPTSPAVSDRTKAEGERVVRAAFPQVTIVRPSLVFGKDDHFFNAFSAMVRRSPVLPLIGGGKTRFQPVHVDDMATGILELLKRPYTAGKTYEFGGPEVYSFRELLELLLTSLERRKRLLPIPFGLAQLQAAFLELLPNPPLTRDQVRLLKTDKVISGTQPTLTDLGVRPRHLRDFLLEFGKSALPTPAGPETRASGG